MKIITAIGNEEINKKIKKINEVNYPDIQYQEAVIEILEQNKDIDLLILSCLLPGELNIYEFINIIKYKNPELKVIIILDKVDKVLNNFLIAKDIKEIYYNNKITIDEILEKIDEINNNINKQNKIKKNKIEEKINNYKNKIIYKINNLLKINKKKSKNNKKNKIISIIGEAKIGKSIFILLLSICLKNKKILILDLNNNNLKIIIGKIIKESNDKIFKWRRNIDIIFFERNDDYDRLQQTIKEQKDKYDNIFIELKHIEENDKILKISDKILLLVEPNLLGINEAKKILVKIVQKQKNQKNKIKILFNKTNDMSISKKILNMLFFDFEIIGELTYESFYNYFINCNAKYVTRKIQIKYIEIFNKIK